MQTFEEQQEARVKILKSEYHHRKLMRDYERGNYEQFGTKESLARLNEVTEDFKVATIQLAEAERALVSYKKFKMWETAEFKKEYTG
jgi:hypothetical protein